MKTITRKLLAAALCLVAAPFAHSADKPDVLFIAIDDMNDWTTLFDDDNPIQTPNLKRLADRGTLFKRAYCASPGCNPSRTAIMTGLRPTTSGVYHNGQAWREKVPDAISLPEHFARHGGYLTRGAGKIYHHGGTGAEPKDRPSFQEFFKKLAIRGPGKNKNYNGYRIEDKTPLANVAFDWGVHDQKMIDVDMCEWVEARMAEKHDAPLFLAAGIFNPHLPFYADSATFERYPKEKVELPPMPDGDMDDVGKVGIRMSDKESFVYEQTTAADPDSNQSLHRMVQCYQAAADYADQMVGRLIDKLDATGRADNTIIVLWSDHGYHLGDKECGVKFTLWEKANHVPFIIVAPGVGQPGSVCGTPVSLVDIYPTLAELAGLPPKEDNDGLSLVPLLKDPDAEWARPALMTEGPGNHAIRTREFRYIRYHNGEEELYADDDPWNHTNLAGDPKYAEVLAEHRKHLPKAEAPGIPARYQTIDEEAWKQKPDAKINRVRSSTQQGKANEPTGSVRDRGFSERGETVIATFEEGTGDWEKTGTAFDKGERRNRIAGFLGEGYINSYLNGDKTVGTLTSPPFKIERKHIKFLIGGGNHPGKVGMELLLDGEKVRSATGNSRKNNKNEEILEWRSWDVAEFVGKEARIRIFDQREGGWGHTVVDHIVQADRGVVTPPLATSAEFAPPEKPGVKLKDEWSTFPLYDQVGYDQELRPQFHFTSRMGWLNDPNGMVYYDGEWHMLFQHFAKGNASGAKSWGNAVSTDLVHWEQLPHAINPYPNVDGSEGIHAIWSGSAVVDELNALGKQEGDTKTLFALYSATHDKFFQGGAYSTDKGRTWTKIDGGKPVIPHQEGFSKGQRDPRILYYAPGKFYVTIMMVGGPDRLVRLWKSTNLLDWEIIGDIPNKAAECIDMYAVPVDGDPDKVKWVIADAGTHFEIGDFDGKNWKGFGDQDAEGKRLRFDYGDAWYAAQAFNQGPDGRVVHVGWLRSKQTGYRPFLEAGMPFTQQMSIPVEITLRTTPEGIRLFRNPVKEIEKLYAKTHSLEQLAASEANEKLRAIQPELIDLTLRCPAEDFTLNLRGLRIRYEAGAQEFVFTNTARVEGEKAAWNRPGPYRDDGIRRIPAPPVEGKVTLRALVDRASLELFVNDGQAAASFVVVPEAANRLIAIESNDALQIESLVVNELASAWGDGVAPIPVAEDAKSSESKPMPSELLASSATKKLEPVKNPRAADEKPNVVVIFIDDMGYGDIGPFGSDHPTPNLDRMAAEGMKLTDFYVSSAACTPSRSALLTGCYADRIGMGASVVFPADKRGLNPDEITIAEILKKGGYATGCFGKWHLGDQPEFMPLAQGFDVYEGIPYSNDMWVPGNPQRNYPPLPWMKQDKAVAHIPDAHSQARITDAITDAAVEFIVENKDRPFFAYVPHSAVHAPFMVTPERLDAAGGDVMRALVGEIDASTGRILDALKQLGIDENTLVFFTNDNGGAGKTSSGPLRGHKFGPKYEGHMRVATLARWPRKIPAGSVTSEIGATIDLMPTIAKFAGQPVPDDRIIDGHDISDILLENAGAESPHETLYYENDGIRQGKWKLVHYRIKADRFNKLYDLEADLGEQNNIADQHPDIVKKLKAELDAHVEEIQANIRPAAFVENPKHLLDDAAGVPTLVEYLGKPAAAPMATQSANPLPVPKPAPKSNEPPSREIKITGKHLLLPIVPRKKPNGTDYIGNSYRIFVDGVMVHQFWANVARCNEDIQFWSYFDMSEFVGKTATIRLIRGNRDGAVQALAMFESSDELRTLKPFYSETGRAQFHFSQKVGWNNDVNGMVYHDGLWHLSWQSNPVGLGWGNMYWGHAVSRDLVHWEEWPRALRIGGAVAKDEPIHPAMALGQAFSGSAVVDEPNTLGLQKGDMKTLIAAYTSNPQGECLACSTDGGRTWHHLNDHQPVIVQPHPSDPNWQKSWGRDPKLIWHEPTKKWIIVTYRMGSVPKEAKGQMAFYSSPDLKTWTEESLSDAVFHECPDFVELPVDGDPDYRKWLLFDATPKYQIGSFDGKTFTSDFDGTRQTIGGSLKAAQCFSNAPDGRVICMVWSRVKPEDTQAPFNQGFTLPFELSLRKTTDGVRCYANPVKELEALRQSVLARLENAAIKGEKRISLAKAETLLEIDLTLRFAEDQKPERVVVQLGENAVVYDVARRTFPDARLTSSDPDDSKLDLHIFADSATVEVFGENGAVYYLQPRKVQGETVRELVIKTEGGAATIENLNVHQLKSIWK